MSSMDFSLLFAEKIDFFKSILPFSSVKWEAYNQKKSQPLLKYFDSKTASLYIRSQKTLNISKERITKFLLEQHSQHQLIDERQGTYLLVNKLTEKLQLVYYFLKSSNEELLSDNDMFLLKGLYEENKKECYVLGFSLDDEDLRKSFQQEISLQITSTPILCPLDAFHLKEINESSCEITHIVCKKLPARFSLIPFDWDQGQMLERLGTILAVISPEEKAAQGVSENSILKENEFQKQYDNLQKNEKEVWIAKYKEILKPSVVDFENIDKVDLFNLYGEPFQDKTLGKKGHEAKIRGELPKNMAGRVKNNRTKEYLANLLMKTKKV